MSAILTALDGLLADRETTVARDLKLNFRRTMTDGALTEDERVLAALCFARSTGLKGLEAPAREEALALGLSADIATEAEDSAAIMGMLNVYYRFRHFVDGESGGAYGPAKLRMQSLAAPAMGKARFELLAIGVSMINGCEKCVTSHEAALMQLGVDREKIHEIARLAATVKGLATLLSS